MSYGWLTESSLIPKEGNEIQNVGSKSLSRLKCLMAEKEDQRNKRRRESATTTTRPTKKFRPAMDRRFEEKNLGIEKRLNKDLESSGEMTQSLEHSRLRLEEKTVLYDALENNMANQTKPGAELSCLDMETKWRKRNNFDQATSTSCLRTVKSQGSSDSRELNYSQQLRERMDDLREQKKLLDKKIV